jgi:glycosyltransferase involved in cell wall biosynthesis
MNDEPLLSVLVLAYNHESYIGECIDSFINSNYENLEIVVLDNGSSDRTFERVTSLKSNPNYLGLEISQAEHGNGVNSGLNLLLSKAQGDLGCFISGDDYTFSSRMSAQVQAFRLNSTLKACYGVPKLFEDTPKERRFWDSHERPRNFFQFSDMALKTLFSPVLGFNVLKRVCQIRWLGDFLL